MTWIGWLATAVFASSYFFKRPLVLRRVQGLAAVLWIVYGVLIQAPPVIVANVIVATLAIWSSVGRPREMALAAESGSAPPPGGDQ